MSFKNLLEQRELNRRNFIVALAATGIAGCTAVQSDSRTGATRDVDELFRAGKRRRAKLPRRSSRSTANPTKRLPCG